MTCDLQRVYVVLPGGRVRQGALFNRAQRQRKMMCRVHVRGFRRPIWLPATAIFGVFPLEADARRALRGEA